MYASVYVRICCVCTCRHVCMHVFIDRCSQGVNVYWYAFVLVHAHVHVYMSIHTCMCVYMSCTCRSTCKALFM